MILRRIPGTGPSTVASQLKATRPRLLYHPFHLFSLIFHTFFYFSFDCIAMAFDEERFYSRPDYTERVLTWTKKKEVGLIHLFLTHLSEDDRLYPNGCDARTTSALDAHSQSLIPGDSEVATLRGLAGTQSSALDSRVWSGYPDDWLCLVRHLRGSEREWTGIERVEATNGTTISRVQGFASNCLGVVGR